MLDKGHQTHCAPFFAVFKGNIKLILCSFLADKIKSFIGALRAGTVVCAKQFRVAGVAFVVALSAGSLAVGEHKQEVVAQSLVRSQLEYTKSYTYDPAATTYPTVAVPADYSISVAVSSVPETDTDIQKITVIVSREEQDILTVADYKVNR